MLKQVQTHSKVLDVEYEPFRVIRACWKSGGETTVEPRDIEMVRELVDPLYCSSRELNAFVYVLYGVEGVYAGAYKVGHTTQNVFKRTASQGSVYKTKTRRVWAIPVYGYFSARALEATLHAYFSAKALGHEWFKLSEEDIALIKSLPRGFDISVKQAA